MSTPNASPTTATFAGHPPSLFVLFFAEMWERFSYYGMRALLVFYMMKGFLGYGDKEAYAVYGAYVALVYMTPFFGGMLADRLLGYRKAVILGGLLMGFGHAVMGIHPELLAWLTGDALAHSISTGAFFIALALLIVGNGFFKPNISSIVGSQYADKDPRLDSGFTIFYIGINLGAAMAPLLCGYVGETYGWHYGFSLATVGMLVGLAAFWIPTKPAKWLILVAAAVAALNMVLLQLGFWDWAGNRLFTAFGWATLEPELAMLTVKNAFLLVVNSAVAIALAAAGVITFLALSREGLPPEAGAPPDQALLKKPVVGPISAEWLTYIGSFVIVPAVALLLWSNAQYQFISDETLAPMVDAGGLSKLAGTLLGEFSRPTGLLLGLSGLAFVYIFVQAVRSHRIVRNRLLVVLVLFGFSALFWSFFEQAGSSMNNFADRNVDRVFEGQTVSAADLGQMQLTLTQEQLGYNQNGKVFTLDQLDDAREANELDVTWTLTEEHVGMGIVSDTAGGSVVPASTFQSANPIYILLFGMLFSAMWSQLGKRGIEPSSPMKFVMGLLQLGLGFIVLWYGASIADGRGMTGMSWLLLGYLLHTTGELCLSPIGLSMVVKLSPKHLVATVMGGWFLATAFSGYVAAIIATFTSVGGHGGADGAVPPPIETIGVYGSVFLNIGLAALASALLLLILVPFLKMGMHEGVVVDEAENG